MKKFISITVLSIVMSHVIARPQVDQRHTRRLGTHTYDSTSDVTNPLDETDFDGTPKNCSVEAWNKQFEKVERRLLNVTNGEHYPFGGNANDSEVPLSANPDLHSNPDVHCKQDTVVRDKDFGYGIRVQANKTVNIESYRSNTHHSMGDEEAEKLAKEFSSF